MSVSLKEIPGLAELLASSAEVETATREDAWIVSTHRIAGQIVRTMTVDDYVALLQFESPLLHRAMPTPEDLAFFLWVLSPELERWNYGARWRKWKCSRRLERWQGRRFGKRIRHVLRLEELERQEREWHAKSNIPFVLPDNAPFTLAAKEAFEYIDVMFLDHPPQMKGGSAKAGMCYLTSWFDLMQSEYHLPTAEVWRMKLPMLFARIKAIQIRREFKVPDFNVERDRVLRNIMCGLREKRYTEADLKAGRVDLKTNRLRNL